MSVNKFIPHRKCMGCYEKRPKSEMIRIVKTPTGEVSLDISGKSSGRGAYICPELKCINSAQKRKSLNRVFSCEVKEGVFIQLKEVLSGE